MIKGTVRIIEDAKTGKTSCVKVDLGEDEKKLHKKNVGDRVTRDNILGYYVFNPQNQGFLASIDKDVSIRERDINGIKFLEEVFLYPDTACR